MKPPRSELLKGTLDLLILKVLAGGRAHGYEVLERIADRSEGELLIEEGSLYPALHRLARARLLEPEWGTSENNRRAKYYRLSTKGRKHLAESERRWERMTRAIGRVLHPACMEGPA